MGVKDPQEEGIRRGSLKDRATAGKFPVTIPIIYGVSEQLQRVFRSHRVPLYQKPFNTLRSVGKPQG